MKYLFIEKHQSNYGVRDLCQALGVSRSGYYGWQERQTREEDPHLKALLEHIRRIHKMSRRTYASPRVHAQLKAEGFAYIGKVLTQLGYHLPNNW